MVKILNKSAAISKASRGYITDYMVDSSVTKDMLRPMQAMNDLLSLMDDSTFNAEVNVIVDAILKNGYNIVERGDESVRSKSKEDTFERDLRGFRLLRQVYFNILIYRNAFIELVKKGKVPKELHTIETTEMNINVTPHGEVLGYTQVPTGTRTNSQSLLHTYASLQKKSSSASVFFTPEECVHIALTPIASNPWGFVDTRSIKDIVEAKQYIESYIRNLFKQNKFRDVWFLKNATSEDQVLGLIENLKAGKINTDKDIVIEGDAEQKQLRDMKEIDHLIRLTDDYRMLIREFLRVPPLMAGDVGQSNKSSGEFQVRYAFENTITSLQSIVEDEINNELFPLMGWGNFKLKHVPIDKPSEKMIVELAVQLKGMGFYKNEDVHKFMVINGVRLPANMKVKSPEELAKEQEQIMGQEADGVKQQLANMNSPSRKPRDKSQIDKNVNEDKETRREQVEGR